MTTLLLATMGQALAWNAVFRIGHETDYNGLATHPGDDHYSTNAPRKARWAYVILYNETATSWVAQWTDDDGEVVFNVNPSHTYHLQLYAHHDHELTGRVLKVKDEVGGVTLKSSTDPFLGSTISPFVVNDILFDAADAGNEWMNVASAASFAMRRRPQGFATASDNGADYDIAMEDPANHGATVNAVYIPHDAASQTVVINPDPGVRAYAEKTTIVHELGHQMFHWATYPGTGSVQDFAPEVDYGAIDSTPCTFDSEYDHGLNTKEYQSAAIVEGVAYWFAAVVFNDITESDCRLLPGSTVWWHHAGTGSPFAFSCQGYDDGDTGGVEWVGFSVDGLDFLGDTHTPIGNYPAFSCLDDTPVTGVATDLDWIRFLWDLNAGEGVPFGHIVEAYGNAMPYDWETSTDAMPAFRYQIAGTLGTAFGYTDEWYAQDSRNGIDR